MIIHCFTSMRNESYMAPFFLRHYEKFCDKIFVWDDESTDGTLELLKAHPKVEILPLEIHGIDDAYNQKIRSETYRKLSRGIADWVMIVDCDEFHYFDPMPAWDRILLTLERQGAQAIYSEGWQMISEDFPARATTEHLYDKIKEGVQDPMYDRLIFKPELNITVGIGHHSYSIPNGALQARTASIKLLHFKYMGEEYMRKRNAKAYKRLVKNNLDHGWGIHSSPGWNGVYSEAWYRDALKNKVKCI
jgi:hypothetical protein